MHSTFIQAVREEEALVRKQGKLLKKGDLAELFGVNPDTITKWSRADGDIPTHYYILAQERYGWSDEYLIGLMRSDYPARRLEELAPEALKEKYSSNNNLQNVI